MVRTVAGPRRTGNRLCADSTRGICKNRFRFAGVEIAVRRFEIAA
jgi:hypothetical protein